MHMISTHDDLSLRIESFAMINLRGVSKKWYWEVLADLAKIKFCQEVIVSSTCPQNHQKFFVPQFENIAEDSDTKLVLQTHV